MYARHLRCSNNTYAQNCFAFETSSSLYGNTLTSSTHKYTFPPLTTICQIHSPHEIISTMGKTGQDARRKGKPCRKVSIHISNKSASDKLKNVSMESSKLLCLNGISFCSKSCKLKTFPLSIARCLLSS